MVVLPDPRLGGTLSSAGIRQPGRGPLRSAGRGLFHSPLCRRHGRFDERFGTFFGPCARHFHGRLYRPGAGHKLPGIGSRPDPRLHRARRQPIGPDEPGTSGKIHRQQRAFPGGHPPQGYGSLFFGRVHPRAAGKDRGVC